MFLLKHLSFLTCTKRVESYYLIIWTNLKFCVPFLITQCHDNIVLKWRLWHTGGNTSFWCEMPKVKRAKGFGRFLALEVSGGMVWLGDTLNFRHKKIQSSLFSFSTFAHNVSTHEKFRTETSLSVSLSMNSSSVNSSASSGTQEVSYLMSSGRPCSAFPHF